MPVAHTKNNYGSVAKLLHWLIFFFLLFLIPLGYFMKDFTPAMRADAVNLHKVTGVCLLILISVRIIWSIVNTRPRPVSSSYWQQVAARSLHLGLYISLLIMALSGLIGSTAAGKAPHIGGLKIQFFIMQSKPLAKFLFSKIHQPLAIILIILIALHILAVLYHHFIKRDAVLKRMLPNLG